MVTAAPAATDCPSPAFFVTFTGAPGVAVAVKVTGEPLRPPEVAVAVCAPAVSPRIHCAVAMPLPFVIELGVMEPPPLVTAQETVTPLTGLTPSVTSTESRRGRVDFTVSVWALPPAALMTEAPPVLPKSTKVAGEPVSPAAVAITVSGPEVAPRVQLVSAAMPDALLDG